MLGMMFYAISLLMVLVYAYEMNQTVRGWRAAPFSTLQESSRCSERLQQALPSILAWLLPFLVFVVLLVLRGTSLRDVVPRPLPPIGPQASNRSQGASGLYCSSCLILIHHAQDICYQYTGRKDSGKESKVFFLMFVSLVLAGCTVLYCRVRGQCRRQSGGANHQPTLENCSCASRSCIACYFQLVFVVCWMPAFLLCILSFTSLQPASLFPLYMAVEYAHIPC
ncbi:uncharacterized protein LOC133390068 isoform X3 [Rhineura floridana]|uniref:uncharacterized protein LOC133390068 isoform X3 n=1 Tax=Rhineura floridana TaxID=261503 RepID=UPI002AC863E0|nr:uncharacterized protein LOC133390068 isoform X3 [Rhineura floridana]